MFQSSKAETPFEQRMCMQVAIEQLQAELGDAYAEQEGIKAEARRAYEDQVALVRIAQAQADAAEQEVAARAAAADKPCLRPIPCLCVGATYF